MLSVYKRQFRVLYICQEDTDSVQRMGTYGADDISNPHSFHFMSDPDRRKSREINLGDGITLEGAT